MAPQIIFGTASLGMDKTAFQDRASVASLFNLLRDVGVRRLDSGARYPPNNPGRAEELIGECYGHAAGFLVDTKVYTDTNTDGSGDLTAAAIQKSVAASLDRLRRASRGIHVLHAHRADPSTPLREQVRAFNDQVEQDHCQAWGISNTPIAVLEEIFAICDEEKLRKPSCYQGMYNVITRGAETELMPLLRKHGVSFNAFSPLAAGFMTGNFVQGTHAGTRFDDDHPLGKRAQEQFGGEDLHRAMRALDRVAAAHGLTTVEVAARWITHHSALGDGDGVILGASREHQVAEMVAMIRRGPLPAAVLESTVPLWNAVKDSRGSIF